MACSSNIKQLRKQIMAQAGRHRGVIVLDHDVEVLASALGNANLFVVTLPAGTPDCDAKGRYIADRIVVTTRPETFVWEAPIHEYGIVSVEKLESIDTSLSYKTNKSARLISKAISTY